MASNYGLRFVSIVVICLAGLFAGCNQSLEEGKIAVSLNHVLLNSPTVTLAIYSTDDAKPPEEAWDRAVERFGGYISGELEIVDAEPPEKKIDEDNPNDGMLLFDCQPSLDHITVAFLPKVKKVKLGVYQRFSDGKQLIIYNTQEVKKFGWLLPSELTWEFILLHELGHAIGVPADVTHTDKAGHCTNHCVMSNLHVLSAFFLNSWDLDFCDDCKGEIAAAKLAG